MNITKLGPNRAHETDGGPFDNREYSTNQESNRGGGGQLVGMQNLVDISVTQYIEVLVVTPELSLLHIVLITSVNVLNVLNDNSGHISHIESGRKSQK